MIDQVLSIEQMQELIELGIDISKASMCYCSLESDEYNFGNNVIAPNDDTLTNCGLYKENVIPTFILQDILTLLPSIIKKDREDCYFALVNQGNCWISSYNICGFEGDYPTIEQHGNSPLDACTTMLKYLKKNNYV